MLARITLFEIRYHLKNPILYITAGLFFLLTFGAMVSDSITIGGAVGNVHRNAPIVIIQFMAVMSVMGLFVVTAFVASSIHRDFALGTHELFFSRPVPKLHYLLGRFLGSLTVSLAVFVGPAAGILVGSFMPWLEPERLGPFMLGPYVFSFLVLVLPNVVFMACTFFTLAGLTRSMLATYMGVVVTFVAYVLSRLLAGDLASEAVAALTDPFGMAPLDLATRYWTIVEQNTLVPPLSGQMLINRLLWLGIGLVILAVGCWRFSYSRATARRRGTGLLGRLLGRLLGQQHDGPESRAGELGLGVAGAAGGADAAGAVASVASAAPGRPVERRLGPGAGIRMLWARSVFETRSILLGVPFLVMLAFGLVNLIGSTSFAERLAGTPVYPVTHLMLQDLNGSFLFLIIIIVTFYAGELIHRERALGLDEITDASPAPSWVLLGAKLAALGATVLVFTVVGMLATVGMQLARGFTDIEPGLYVRGLLVAVVPFLLIAVLAAAVQVVLDSKMAGYLVMLLFLISFDVLDALGLEHRLYRYAEWPRVIYSDMNGYGHFVTPMVWFGLYWTCFAVALVGLAMVLLRRGTEGGWRIRLAGARQRLRGPALVMIAGGLAGFVLTGGFIFYNTNVLNDYLPADELEARQAEYEKSFRQYKDLLQPRVVDVRTDVDIFPAERRVEIRGRYLLRNIWGSPIKQLHVNISPDVRINHLDLPEHQVVLEDRQLGYSIIDLARPLEPGATAELGFDLSVINRGFVNNGSLTQVVANGTFFNNRDVLPLLGYLEERQLIDRNARRKHDLPPARRMASVDDEAARRSSYLTSDSDWIHFETTVSTSADQIALAPGTLEREWTEGGRRYFHYRMETPILHFFAYLSADYTVRRDRWHDVDIAVYYHRPHSYNVDRMIEGVKQTLEYCESAFSPFQYHEVRIVEFPRYARFAQSFPGMIPFSEGLGFIAKINDGDGDVDYVFDVTAHEVAHQWWAHQMIGANVQGATLMSEALAQYTSLMVMQHRYGPRRTGKMLKYELDEYLRGRGGELVEEMPLMLVENQPYIHYRKGSMAMYALQDAVGEARLNHALARFLSQTAFTGPPYPISPELLQVLHEELPEGSDQLLEDLLETITLYSNRTLTASFTELPDGRYLVRLTVEAHKMRCDGQGVETEIALDDMIDIGVFDEDEEPLLLEKRRLMMPVTTFELVVDRPPAQAGIDPYHKLIDRVSDDNLKDVERAEKLGGATAKPNEAGRAVVSERPADPGVPTGATDFDPGPRARLADTSAMGT